MINLDTILLIGYDMIDLDTILLIELVLKLMLCFVVCVHFRGQQYESSV